jgi:DNA repair exonuclease SbcCD ATPase subunit
MRLRRLQLTNFKGVASFILDVPGSSNVSILGQNATGKTSIADSICWLLFDKDSRGQKDFSIKTIDPETGEALHGLEHTVEADFDLETAGKFISLKKTFHEVWTKKRGAPVATFTGHETLYWVNAVPVKMKEYNEQVGKIADPEMFRLLTQPNYFPEQLPWQKRRSILLEVCGDVSDADVIASSAELQPLAEIIAGRTLDDHKKTVAASMKKINDELKQIPPRIDELTRQHIGTDNEIDLADNQRQEAETVTALDAIKTRIAQADAGSEAATLTKEIAQAQATILDIENLHRQEIEEIAGAKEKELAELREWVTLLGGRLASTTQEHKNKCAEKPADNREQITAEIERLRAEWYEADAQVYTYAGASCPQCGFNLSETPDAEENFNRAKADLIEKIDARGKELKGKMAGAEAELAAATKQIADEVAALAEKKDLLDAELVEKTAARDSLQKEVDAIRARPAMDRPDHLKATVALANLKSRLATAQSGNASLEMDKLTRERDRLTSLLDRIRQRINLAEQKEKNDARIGELKAEEKRLAGEYERLANELHLMEQFTRAKVDMLEGQINSKFKLARFSLFENQINGGLSDCCSVLVAGVPYSSGLNNGMRLNAGLDIIQTLGQHYGISMPVLVDNAESVTELLPIDAQVIRLVVSAEHKELTIA